MEEELLEQELLEEELEDEANPETNVKVEEEPTHEADTDDPYEEDLMSGYEGDDSESKVKEESHDEF